jgi:hypothetical protein
MVKFLLGIFFFMGGIFLIVGDVLDHAWIWHLMTTGGGLTYPPIVLGIPILRLLGAMAVVVSIGYMLMAEMNRDPARA